MPKRAAAAGTGSLSALVKAHRLVFGAWLVLFIAHTALVATRRSALHRRLGIVGAVLGVAMIWLGYAVAMVAARRGHDLSLDDILIVSIILRPCFFIVET
jgi:hypothetical protein